MKNKYKLWIIISLAAVFMIGVAAGIFGERYVIHKKDARLERLKPHFPTLETMAKELQLNDTQKGQIGDIFKKNEERLKMLRGELHQRLSEVRCLLKGDIESLLTPEQKQRFEAMIDAYLLQKKMEGERSRMNQHKQPDGSKEKTKGEVK